MKVKFNPIPSHEIIYPPEQGRFLAQRKYNIHEGVDLYCPEHSEVVAIEDGIVLDYSWFTGPMAYPPSPWWNNTSYLMIQCADYNICYGEIEVNKDLMISDDVKKGQIIGTVMRVLKKDKGLPTSMLHLERYIKGTRFPVDWPLNTPQPECLLDPTSLVFEE